VGAFLSACVFHIYRRKKKNILEKPDFFQILKKDEKKTNYTPQLIGGFQKPSPPTQKMVKW
jgi:hypothetical protein